MKVIGPSNMQSIRVNGRDIIEVPPSKKNDGDVIVAMNPLTWLMPRRTAGGGIAFGPGISYYTGEKPTGYNSVFPTGKRICLVETLTPTSDYYTGNNGSYDYKSIQVTSVDRQAEIIEIPAPYMSSVSTIQVGVGVPEIRITVLGYCDSFLGLAVGEKIRFTHDAGTEPDYVRVVRYPYVMFPLSGYTAADAERAEKYYYSEEALIEDL